MSEDVEREAMEYDVVIVGAGPAGLAAAIRLKQLAAAAGREVSVAVLEKGSEVGAHILSGAVIDPKALNELIPDWKEKGAPLETPVTQGPLPGAGAAGRHRRSRCCRCRRFMHNHGNYIASLANLCRWLATRPKAWASRSIRAWPPPSVVFDEDGAVKGVVAGVFGVGRDGEQKPDYQPGLELHGKYIFIAEGARGSLAKQMQAKFGLDRRQGAAEVRHRAQGALAGSGRGVPARPRAAHRGLAAGRTTPAAAASCTTSATTTWPSASSSTSTTRTPGSRRSTSSSASSTIRRSAAISRAASASPMARGRSPRAASSRCRSWPSPAAC